MNAKIPERLAAALKFDVRDSKIIYVCDVRFA